MDMMPDWVMFSSRTAWNWYPLELYSARAWWLQGKPAPDVYLEAMRRTGCDQGQQAIIVEDTVNGLKAGRAAGAYCIAVTTSLPRAALTPFADLVLDNLQEIIDELPELCGHSAWARKGHLRHS